MLRFKNCVAGASLLLICTLLCSCSRSVRSPSDELRMYAWSAELENGNRVSLQIDDDKARFTASNDAFTLTVSGAYLIDDELLVISDEATRMNYSFRYQVHGDSVELSCGDGTIILQKL